MESRSKIRLTDAVAAIIRHEDGRFLMQLRDAGVDIPYPGYWGLFGGTLADGETPERALCRELREELEFAPRRPAYFTRLDIDVSTQGLRVYSRWYYVVDLSGAEHDRLVLHEGAAKGLFGLREILAHGRVTPCDAYALWLYANRDRFTA